MAIANIFFLILFIAGIVLFIINVRKIIRNINLGKNIDLSDHPSQRWKTMARVALGQSKLMTNPIPGILHFVVYAGFIIINIEVLEIIIDGISGTHRVFSFVGGLYSVLIASFEFLALGVLLACALFLIRRNIIKVKRFWSKEITGWPRSDANIILTIEIALMTAFFSMNAADHLLQNQGVEHYTRISESAFPVSSMLMSLFSNFSIAQLIFIERFAWWFHIIGILGFMNYLPYSKHFHVILSFPNVYYSNLNPKGKLSNLESVTREVKLMFDPSAVPLTDAGSPGRFGARDVTDLSWKQLMDAYSCTECGRCTAACPANQTGKKLSPRKIMMDTRDRLQEVGNNFDKHGKDYDDGKSLLGNYILPEEIWACTTCNACVQECPVNIDPLSIIVDIRRFIVMEQSGAPTELNMMLSNIENNGAPWQYPTADRLNWAKE